MSGSVSVRRIAEVAVSVKITCDVEGNTLFGKVFFICGYCISEQKIDLNRRTKYEEERARRIRNRGSRRGKSKRNKQVGESII